MNGADFEIFQSTMFGLEAGLRVIHIATFDLKCCDAKEDLAAILADPLLTPFDQIPVRRNGRIVGVVERRDGATSRPAVTGMRLLDDSLLVSAEEPLTRFIPLVAESPYRLVVKGTEINGIVTRSDLLKLPVRLLAFALITHLEMVLGKVISSKCADDCDWLKLLSEGRRKKLEEKIQGLRQQNLDPPLLELTEFCDKRDIVATLCGYGTRFKTESKEIEELRNAVAHAASYAQNDNEVRDFVKRLSSAEDWITGVNTYLTPSNIQT